MDSCSLCYRCTGLVGLKLANTITSSQGHSQGTEQTQGRGTSHYFNPEIHQGIQKCSKGTKDSSVAAITFCCHKTHNTQECNSEERNQLVCWAAERWKISSSSTLPTSTCAGSRCAAQPHLPCSPLPSHVQVRNQTLSQGSLSACFTSADAIQKQHFILKSPKWYSSDPPTWLHATAGAGQHSCDTQSS